MGSSSIFKFVTKSAKQQIASVSLTVQDRAISSKFLKHCIQDNYPAQEPLFLYFSLFGTLCFCKQSSSLICVLTGIRARNQNTLTM